MSVAIINNSHVLRMPGNSCCTLCRGTYLLAFLMIINYNYACLSKWCVKLCSSCACSLTGKGLSRLAEDAMAHNLEAVKFVKEVIGSKVQAPELSIFTARPVKQVSDLLDKLLQKSTEDSDFRPDSRIHWITYLWSLPKGKGIWESQGYIRRSQK